MLKSYLIIAVRSLLTQRLYSAINVFGLAIGLASCILMSLFVFSEMGFDAYHAKADNIVRVVTDLHPPGSTEQRFSTSQYRTGEAFVQEFAELTAYTRLRNVRTSLGTQGRMFNESLAYVTDPNVFDFFSFDALSGDLKTALTRPNTVVLTESTALRLLGGTNVLGQTLMAGSNIALEVTAVIKDLPDNTHLAINALISWGTMGQMLDTQGWEENPSFNYYTYFETANGTDVEALEAKIPAYMEEKVREGISDVITLKLQRLKDIYLTSKQAFEMRTNGDINTVYAFSTIAILILLIACINFMNLSTARATKR
ncbi:MAG: ABC transporter permease, partial [Psychrosphaera sp.]|nr:ABC transporter permease [Psychrosphaera sp.]